MAAHPAEAQIQSFFEQHKELIIDATLFTGSVLSSVSTMYGAQDVIREFLTAVGYQSEDIDSDGEVNVFNYILAETALWAIPSILTIGYNAAMRFVAARNTLDFFRKLWTEGSYAAFLPFLGYAVPAVFTAASDMLINVFLSKKLKEEWAPWAIYSEMVLSLIFLIPLNLYYVHLLSQRVQCAWIKYFRSVDLKGQSNQFKAIACELKQVVPQPGETLEQAQANKLRELFAAAGFNTDGDAPENYRALREKASDDLDELKDRVNQVCLANDLRDGSSWGSTAATAATVVVASAGGAVTMRSPLKFWIETCQLPNFVAGLFSITSGGTKMALYIGSWDSVMWFFKHFNQLFDSSRIGWGTGTALGALSAIGFIEVAQLALNAAFPSMSENLKVCYWLLIAAIYSNGGVANINGFLACAQQELQRLKQYAMNANEPDLVKGFEELGGIILNSVSSAPNLNPDEEAGVRIPLRSMRSDPDQSGSFPEYRYGIKAKKTEEPDPLNLSESEDEDKREHEDEDLLGKGINIQRAPPQSPPASSSSLWSCCSSVFLCAPAEQRSNSWSLLPRCLQGAADPFRRMFNF